VTKWCHTAVKRLWFYRCFFVLKWYPVSRRRAVFSKTTCFCLHNALFYYKIVLKVVESGTKWLKVVNFTPLEADRGRHFMAGD
jgi:hypothetical protein